MKFLMALVIGFSVIVSCKDHGDYTRFTRDPILYCKTVHQLNTVVMGNNFSPIVASRNYLYATVAGYEAMAGGYSKRYTSLTGQLKGLKQVPRPDTSHAIDVEFASLLAFCRVGEAVTFPAGSMKEYVDSIKQLALDNGMSDEVLANTVAYADTVSAAILAWSKRDNYAETRSSAKYTVIDSPGRWIPTPPAYASAMEPHWNTIRPLVMDSCSQFQPPPPYKFDITNKNSDYYKEVMAIKNSTDSLTEEQKHMAEFWDDNPFKLNVNGHVMFGTKKFSPPGHWMSIVGIAAEKAKADYGTTVEAYAITAISMFDAFIQCWHQKFKYNTVRPETVINKYIDPNWRPYLQTPPFPEYTCGHSTVSASAAEALTSIFGDNFHYTDTTELEFGIKSRSFNSFRDASLENNWARYYGGIHYHHSCIVSTEYGKKVGELVVSRLKMKNNN